MEYLIIILVVSMLYFIIPSKKEILSDQWDGSDIDGGTYEGDTPKVVKKKTRKRTKVLPKKVKKVVKKKKVTKRKNKK